MGQSYSVMKKLKELENCLLVEVHMWFKNNKRLPLHLDVKHLHCESEPKKTSALGSGSKRQRKCSNLLSLYISQYPEDTQLNEAGKCLFISLIK